MLSEELEQFVGHLRAAGRPAVDLLIPGADEEAVRAVLGDDVPRSVITWFAWCNGVAGYRGQTQDEASVVPGHWPVSLEEAQSIISDYAEILVLPGRWVPLLEDGAGDVYAAVWGDDGEDAKIVDVKIDDSLDVAFADVAQMVAYFNRCYERRAYFVGADGRLSMDLALAVDLLPPTV